MSKEIQQIVEKLSSLGANEKAILATVIDVVGSGYRRPGARMLIDQNGYGIGTVSGGCLEADVLERAKKVLQSGNPVVITYDTTEDENSVFGLGMGCRGIVRILLEKVTGENPFFDYADQVFKQRKSFSTATLVLSNLDYRKIGSRLFFYDSEVKHSDFESEISDVLLKKIATNTNGKLPFVESFDFGEVFFETIAPPLNLQLFGAGYDALPLIKFAKEFGWRVAVVDHRPAFANRERLPEVDDLYAKNLHDLGDEFFEDENAAAVIMTHNYDRDRKILPRLINSKCLYIGALGPKKRTEKILDESGETFSAEQLAKLHAPVGLDIGADTPESIALSIVAEIQAVLKSREGGFLRKRQGSIYGRSE